MNEIISSDEIKNSETYKNSEKMYQNNEFSIQN